MSEWLTASVLAAQMVIPDGRQLLLDVPGWPGSLAGQHLDVRLTAEDGYQAVRSYSVASHGETTLVELAVDRMPDGEVSPYLVDDLRAGDQFEVKGPIGLYFVWRPTQTEPVQLIAGGSGVVPLVSMVRAHHASGSTAPFRLLYSVRTPEHAYYADELAALAGETLRVDWAYSRRTPPGWPHPPRRLDGAAITSATFTPAENPMVYICGSNRFVEAAASALVEIGHDPTRIKTERYGGA